ATRSKRRTVATPVPTGRARSGRAVREAGSKRRHPPRAAVLARAWGVPFPGKGGPQRVSRIRWRELAEIRSGRQSEVRRESFPRRGFDRPSDQERARVAKARGWANAMAQEQPARSVSQSRVPEPAPKRAKPPPPLVRQKRRWIIGQR